MNELPWLCPDHPDSATRKSWDEHHVGYLDPYRAGLLYRAPPGVSGKTTNYRYGCNVCGRQLRVPEEEKTHA